MSSVHHEQVNWDGAGRSERREPMGVKRSATEVDRHRLRFPRRAEPEYDPRVRSRRQRRGQLEIELRQGDEMRRQAAVKYFDRSAAFVGAQRRFRVIVHCARGSTALPSASAGGLSTVVTPVP
jgi:hypothetical protein